MTGLHVAVAQMQSTEDVTENVLQIRQMIERLSSASRIVCFPENCLYLRVGPSGGREPSFHLSEPCFTELEALATQVGRTLILGSVPYIDKGVVSNAMVLIAPGEKSRAIYKKIHLFDVDVEGEGRHRESDRFTAGQEPQILDLENLKWGLSICYDIRFAELYLYYAKQNCQILLVPSAFLPTTGMAHWEILLRARAIESQAFVLAPAQAGVHIGRGGLKRTTYGHSMVVDPWGRVLAEADVDGPQLLEVELDLSLLKKVRASIPQSKHRKLKIP